ncbi:N-acetylmuramic acid 6-phosphate etherase [Microcystis aeruginosa NIES-1211]|jgi:N-acetylmuramic acid 6-phosphate etherase|uniref:N-acetylmuramic acid 6-phosphate etherase n=1 Tax=Microcystis aeruginosa NIES-2549 TaxID=1641812 RepID=A0A0F6RMW6_MICAE|nr:MULTISPECIES: N-acetylmuramic acid 6-phosphate etherase [Microcystis]AKE65900.1 N-acetylmuramic acid 6-phosphate etherase [Microcystis aeruginosa NIES-2549]AOC54306.1 N-acetylmuramic acid 6-phosphate etherase [Microcystis aeruginosa NIES-2481]AVQ73189.1 N-acetylmuramic acid 6-phosphate etherase [Microcystis sp. MC19]CCI30617.1 N-acetylmuramic acid 6-phosphate etherase [Microcystis sp. T1-4]GBL13454.1 N-acetylmuramic acid 6-phosphate etherase [Microcystis aeruginosa NIES-1211]
MEQWESRGHLLTEQINPNSLNLDQLNPLELVDLFNREDAQTLKAIAMARQELALAISLTGQALAKGGRLFYIGAGTSGRLGVLDAAECPPTFCTPPELVQGIIAGGAAALVRSSEDLEDKAEDGAAVIAQREIHELDVVVGITAGGTTPYVHGALQAAKQRGATTIAISCVPAEQVEIAVDVDIRLLTGPELLAGSTRLKAGTVTKMALNILSTGTMVMLGKVYGNQMVDVAVTNHKLHDRALRIICNLSDISREEAAILLEKSGRRVKLALLMQKTGLSAAAGQELLQKHRGQLRAALQAYNQID